ncbi:MAG TPA: N-acetylmuramoyl-L-alanine amidase [Terrimicrobiaceae bacterium]
MLALISAELPQLRGQLTDDQKKKLFLKAREDIRPVPQATPTPRPKPKPAPTPKPTPIPRTTPKPTPQAEEAEPTPRLRPVPSPKEAPTPEAEPTPRPRPIPAPKEAPTPDVIPLESATPSPTPPQIPKGRTPRGEQLEAPILIEKSGLEEDQGLEPVPRSSGGWFRRWRFLSPQVRKAIDRAKVKKGRWKYIIVHNSGTRQGNARIIETYHRRIRKMQNGLAYHFVIGNGNSSGDGEIEIGPRWTKQLNGGHVASDYLNNIAIGVCLVGDLNRDQPTRAQMAALDELITYLRGRVGKIKGRRAIVLPHKKINPRPTDCPGDRFPYGWLQRKFGS